MAQIFNLRNKNTAIGFDWGTSSVKIVGLKRKGDQYELSHCVLLEFPLDCSDEQKQQTIKKQLSKSYFQNVPVMVGLPGGSMNIRYIKLPEMSAKDFQNAAIWEVSEELLYDLSAALIYTELLDTLQDGDLRKAYGVVAAVPRERLQKEVTKFKRFFPKFRGFGIDAFAATTAVVANELADSKVIAVLDIGARWSKLVIVSNGKIMGEREIGFGTIQINEEMHSVFGIEMAETEILKRKIHIVSNNGENEFVCLVKDKETCVEAVKFILEQLIQELRLSLQFFAAQLRQDINKVYLTGGGALMKGIELYFAEKLALPVEIADPFQKILLNDELFEKDEIQLKATQFATAVGLAMSALGKSCKGNFDPFELLVEKKKEEQKEWITLRISSLSALMIVLGMLLFLDWRLQYLKLHNSVLGHYLENFQQKQNKVEKIIFQTGNINSKFRAILKAKQQQPHWSALLDEISQCIPFGVWLTKIKVNPASQSDGENIEYLESPSSSAFVLEMQGKALFAYQLRRFYGQMQKSKFCTNVVLKKMVLGQEKQRSVLNFHIVSTINKNAESKRQLDLDR